MKTCTCCKEEKDEGCFYKRKKGKGGLSPVCKACSKEKHSKYCTENKEKLDAYRLEYYERNKDRLKEQREQARLLVRDMSGSRVCTRCGVEKPEVEFYADRSGCKECCRATGRRYREENIDKIRKYWRDNRDVLLARHREYWAADREKIAARRKAYGEKNKAAISAINRVQYAKNRVKRCEKQRRYREDNKDKLKADCKKWAIANKDRKNAYMRLYVRNRVKSDPIFALSYRVRARIRHAVEGIGTKKNSSTSIIIGCSFPELREYLGISGIEDLVGKHIDHICPLAQAKTEEELYKLSHFSNLRVIDSHENMIKSDNKTEEGEHMCLLLLGRPWSDEDRRGVPC